MQSYHTNYYPYYTFAKIAGLTRTVNGLDVSTSLKYLEAIC